MFKKKNKNLHRALIALMVLGLLVCLCFTLASAATAVAEDGAITGGPTAAGKLFTVIALIVLFVVAFLNTKATAAAGVKEPQRA